MTGILVFCVPVNHSSSLYQAVHPMVHLRESLKISERHSAQARHSAAGGTSGCSGTVPLTEDSTFYLSTVPAAGDHSRNNPEPMFEVQAWTSDTSTLNTARTHRHTYPQMQSPRPTSMQTYPTLHPNTIEPGITSAIHSQIKYQKHEHNLLVC